MDGSSPVLVFEFGDLTPQSSVSPYTVDEVDDATTQILAPFKIKSSKEFTLLAIEVYPYLSLEQLSQVNAFQIYLWRLDDIVDNPKVDLAIREQLLNESLASMHDPTAAVQALCKLGVQLVSNISNSEMRSYVTQKLQLYYRAVMQRLSNAGGNLTVEEFLNIRLHDGAVFATLPFCFSDVTDFTPYYAYLEGREGKHVLRLTNLNICYINDIYSYPKDILEKSNFNVIFSHQYQYHTTAEEAMRAAVHEANQQYYELSLNQDELMVTQRLLRWCEGSLRWHREAARYKQTAEQLDSQTVTPSV